MRPVKAVLKSVLRPARLLAGRFVICPEAPKVAACEPLTSTIFYKAAQVTSAEQIDGDYLEFGVSRGDSFVQAFKTLRAVYEERYSDRTGIHSPEYRAKVRCLWDNMRFFAFDSFQGLPEPTGIDTQTSDFATGKFECKLDEFKRNLESNLVDASKVNVISGWFQDTCTEETKERCAIKSASIIHIDCDLYESTTTVLKFIESLLVDGTVLIFDDWYCFRGNPNLGEQRAFRDWSVRMTDWIFTEYQKEGPWRNSFIASRKA